MVIYYIVNCPHPVAGTTYGIAGQMFDLQGSTVKSVFVPDISCDRQSVLNLGGKCTDGQLTLEQIWDVVYDTIQ